MRLSLLLRSLTVLAVGLTAIGCAARSTAPSDSTTAQSAALDPLAERYVKLVLAVGQQDPIYVDAYYGPKPWAEEAKATKLPIDELRARAAALTAALEATPTPADPFVALRRRYLLRQTQALAARVRMLGGEKLSFDDESQALYDARAPVHAEADFLQLQAELERLLPGAGPLSERIERFRQAFVIPPAKLEVVFRAAIDEARRRTLAHLPLPANEEVTLEFVTQKTWGGYNWYLGNAKSLVQINTDLPIFAARALDVAAHESYPGHHVYNVLLEQHLMKERGWVEFSVYPLFSPQSLIAEGSANYGIDVAFPDAAAFLRDVLFPLAGLDPAKAETYLAVERLTAKLSYADNEAARGLLDGKLTREQARDYLVRYSLRSPARAEKWLTNLDVVRSYVINYNLGRDLTADWVERQGGTKAAPEKRWSLFGELLSSPRLPADLR